MQGRWGVQASSLTLGPFSKPVRRAQAHLEAQDQEHGNSGQYPQEKRIKWAEFIVPAIQSC